MQEATTTTAAISTVRRFNRTVTQRIGVLNDAYLARDRPLGQCRVLWEIAAQAQPPDSTTCDIRRLRASLDLDSGYLSRLLRSVEADGLVEVDQSGKDGRVRTASLTKRGKEEVAELDQRSDELATSILAPLNERQRATLIQAMEQVVRLLVASTVEVKQVDPRHPDARRCMRAYFDELAQRFDNGFDPTKTIPTNDDELTLPKGLLLIATLHSEPVGCGALKFHGKEPTELKRMWVSPTVRGIGLGRRILTELEKRAGERGATVMRLETNRNLHAAIGLYKAAGYEEVPAFNDEPYADHWFEKEL